MRNGKYAAPHRRRRQSRALATVLALTLALGCVAGGTLAWLTSTTQSIANTFTIGDINISLTGGSDGVFKTESPSTTGTGTTTTYVPGQKIAANPTVTVAKDSEACFLFIHIVEDNNTFDTDKKVIQWELNGLKTDTNTDGVWTAIKSHPGYYYTTVNKSTEDVTYSLVKDNKLTVNPELTEPDIATMKTAGYPTITITAAAVQMENIPDSNGNGFIGFTDAWGLLPADFKPSGT